MSSQQSQFSPEKSDGSSVRKLVIKWLILALIGVSIVLFFIYRLHPNKDITDHSKFDPSKKPTPVLIANPVKRDVNIYLTALGNVTSQNLVTVRTLVDGKLLKLDFTEGEMVKAGKPLAEIDPRPFEIQLAQGLGQLTKDKALLENAVIDMNRYKTLLAQDSVSKQVVDTQQSLIVQEAGAVEVDKAQIATAKLQLSYCHITAPISGKVGLRQVDPGNIIHSTDAAGIVSIAQIDPITVLFNIPEDNLPILESRIRSKKDIIAEAYDRSQKIKLATGILVATDNQVDTTTGTIKLRAKFKNIDQGLFPSQFVNIKLLVDTQKNAIVIPIAALQHGKKGDYVYVSIHGDSVSLRPVTTGGVDGEFISIIQGLGLGDAVVVDGLDKLRDGAKIKVVLADDAQKNSQHNQEHNPSKNTEKWQHRKNME